MKVILLKDAEVSGKKFKRKEEVDVHPAIASAWLSAEPPIAKEKRKGNKEVETSTKVGNWEKRN